MTISLTSLAAAMENGAQVGVANFVLDHDSDQTVYTPFVYENKQLVVECYGHLATNGVKMFKNGKNENHVLTLLVNESDVFETLAASLGKLPQLVPLDDEESIWTLNHPTWNGRVDFSLGVNKKTSDYYAEMTPPFKPSAASKQANNLKKGFGCKITFSMKAYFNPTKRTYGVAFGVRKVTIDKTDVEEIEYKEREYDEFQVTMLCE